MGQDFIQRWNAYLVAESVQISALEAACSRNITLRWPICAVAEASDTQGESSVDSTILRLMMNISYVKAAKKLPRLTNDDTKALADEYGLADAKVIRYNTGNAESGKEIDAGLENCENKV
ncbi:hypothetical protein AC578_8042 [Pseudocercospora eumusae]|uniref:Uncharacterized protein n=1 Tax=Pseudocercospora eumusae TaxID=321146 RepID=A0A139HGU2_9PEZI|nr:hypothetical protein AC578_8042 [Pseudocercospora eumusae]